MHISLDSALGQQRRLNSVGESITQIAPDPAAAYSLRSLTGGDPKVVRVRRASDNHEQDFTASDVSSGALQDFVNAQVVAPLDIQALSATGRDGDFLIAKAAYSLRSLGTRQATLAATGDTVARSDGQFVAQVRRSSDDALKSFTATEVTDGTLLAFVNEIQTLGTVTNSVGNNGFTLTNASSTGFTATTDTATGVCGWPYTAKSGDKITVSFDAVVRSGTPQFIPRRATALSGSNLIDVVSDSAISVNSTASYSFEFTYNSDDAGSLTFSEGDDNADFDISNFQVTVFKGAGLVKTWYDQSVTTQAGDTATGNHATQATAAEQPKIVDAGSLLNELDFDGTDDSLAIDFGADLSQANSFFMVHQSDSLSSSANEFFDRSSGSGDRTLLDQNGSNYRMLGASSADTGVAVTTDKSLIFALYNGASSLFAKNGTATSALNAGTSGINQNSSLGASSSGTRFYNGTMQEVIIYNSDQTDNRTAIEANMGEVYSIDLPAGFDPGDNEVDGFVETWYDQSGNSNDAVQTTAGSQPKIVNAGSLLADGIDFDGSDDTLIASSVQGMGATATMITASVRDGGSGAVIALGSSASSSNTYFATTEGGSVSQTTSRNTTSVSINASVSGVTRLSFSLTTGQTSTKSGALGGALVESTSDYGNDFTSGELDTLTFGKLRPTSGTLFNGRIREAIVYNTDQTDNRVAIEANIANHYNITLV